MPKGIPVFVLTGIFLFSSDSSKNTLLFQAKF
ncbi:hypothetical protein TM_1671 [Thermotoga maritima MSB8]|uniref:Uncharacterized protein n=1 Tax=Thermotoga maritima (strain ATCC 43589 / DSM 3109 / JCM 10099 / NBRC 100826 / MSB8) TaxID=243274 RepID=Q9X1Z9_THEMA|nr:hypothetical protein TM_1671 [Thermotoga maritima MSB8]